MKKRAGKLVRAEWVPSSGGMHIGMSGRSGCFVERPSRRGSALLHSHLQSSSCRSLRSRSPLALSPHILSSQHSRFQHAFFLSSRLERQECSPLRSCSLPSSRWCERILSYRIKPSRNGTTRVCLRSRSGSSQNTRIDLFLACFRQPYHLAWCYWPSYTRYTWCKCLSVSLSWRSIRRSGDSDSCLPHVPSRAPRATYTPANQAQSTCTTLEPQADLSSYCKSGSQMLPSS